MKEKEKQTMNFVEHMIQSDRKRKEVKMKKLWMEVLWINLWKEKHF